MPRRRVALTIIAIHSLLNYLGFRVWQAIFSNFAVEELGVRASQMGLIQAIREVPGLMGFLVGALALLLVEMRIAGLSVVVMGVGICLTAVARDLSGLIAATLVMSVGFHFFYSSNASALLVTVGSDEAPKMLGRLNSLGSLASVLGTLLILGTLETWGYRTLFGIAGGVVVVGGLALLPFGRQPMRVQRTRRRTPLRRRYWVYYGLQLLMGGRRHLSNTFAVFLLVGVYRVTPQTFTLILLINGVIGAYLYQALGTIVARVGERRVLAAGLAVLTLIFLGYAVIPLISALKRPTYQMPGLSVGGWVLFPAFPATPGLLILLTLFVVDRMLFGLSFTLQSYFQKIAVGPEEITPNIALGQTMNHVAAVAVPIVGGLVWEAAGARYTFLAGVFIGLLTLALALRMQVYPIPVRSGTGTLDCRPDVQNG